MPTTYAHYRMGQEAIKRLPDETASLIFKYENLFNFGVHGPDIFFYYKALKSNPVTRFGSKMHTESMRSFLEKAKPLYEKSSRKDALKVYLLGFTAHFALDSYCHGYVERKKETEPRASHSRIESQFDRYLLEKDGFDPITKSVTFSLIPTKSTASVISEVFPEWDEKIIGKSISDQKMYLDLLKANSMPKRIFLTAALTAARQPETRDMMIDLEEFDYCRDSNLRLDKLSGLSILHYPELAEQVIAYLDNGKPLGAYFDNHFGPKNDYKEIPVLSYEEEKSYCPHRQQ